MVWTGVDCGSSSSSTRWPWLQMQLRGQGVGHVLVALRRRSMRLALGAAGNRHGGACAAAVPEAR